MIRALAIMLASFASALMAGCGGGGGDPGGAGTVAATTAFPLLAGYRARISAGSNDNFTISGTCAGIAQIANGVATASNFEGVAGFAATQNATVTFSNCTPAASTASGTNYFDANYASLGTSVSGVEYSTITTVPMPLPTSVKVGDSAVYATLTTYADSTKAVLTGQRVLNFVIEADTASTAIANLVAKTYGTSNQLLLTQQIRYRMVADGTLTLVTIDVQYAGTSTAHLLYTKV